jgi:hypothetical protein
LPSGRAAHVAAVFRLAILFAMDAAWSAEIARHVVPVDDNGLLASLEVNRLRNYLKSSTCTIAVQNGFLPPAT